MRLSTHRIRILAPAVGIAAIVSLSSSLAATRSTPVSVKVPHHPRIAGDVTISFRPVKPLPSGGYYYAAAVLAKYYAKHLRAARCARASNMEQTEYDYPNRDQRVNLVLGPEKYLPPSGRVLHLHWCAGATYTGGIYAVPHPPPCSRSEPCYGHSTVPECYPGEELCSNGKRVYGKPFRRYERAGELPRPRDSSTRIVARFLVRFPG